MALGDANNYGNRSNNNGSKIFEPTFYSRIRIKNRDKLSVGFTFSKGLMKMEIVEEKEGYKYEPLISISLSATKAKLLKAQIEGFFARMKSGEFIDPNEAVGVNTGIGETSTFIAFGVTGNRTDIPEHCFKIGKVNSSGVVENVVEFVFNVDYDFSLHWNDINAMNVEKEIDQFMGIKTVIDVLNEFIMSSSGAIGASVWDIGRYEMATVKNRFDPLYDKLGIERRQNGSKENFFNRQGSMNPPQPASSSKKSYDEIEDMFD